MKNRIERILVLWDAKRLPKDVEVTYIDTSYMSVFTIDRAPMLQAKNSFTITLQKYNVNGKIVKAGYNEEKKRLIIRK